MRKLCLKLEILLNVQMALIIRCWLFVVMYFVLAQEDVQMKFQRGIRSIVQKNLDGNICYQSHQRRENNGERFDGDS